MIEQPTATERELRSYLANPTSLGLIRSLLQEKQGKCVGELLAYAAVIEVSLPHAGHSSGFLGYVEEFKARKASLALRVWTTPSAYHWNAMARMLLDASLHHIAPAGILKHYLEFLGFDLEQGLIAHLNDFGRFVLSACIIERAEVHFDFPVSIRLPSALPGTGLALLTHGNGSKTVSLSALDQSTIDRLAALRNNPEDEWTEVFESEDGSEVIARRMPRWKGQSGEILIDAFEPCLNLSYVETYPRIRAQQPGRFLNVLDNALDLLAKYNPKLVEEICLVTSSITPMDAAGADAEMCSGTSSAIFGACFLSITDEPLYLAEMLLHEFCHNKLRLFEDFFGLLLPEASNKPQYYSPWRDDPRPLEGIQHGLFVFGSIAYFWLSICRNVGATEYQMALARRRVATLVRQLKYASEEFSLHAALTEHGQTFLNEMNDWIGDLDVQIEGWDLQDMLPVFSGVMSDKSLREVPVAEALFRHRSNWDCSYGADADGRRS